MGQPGKTGSVHIERQWVVVSAETVNSHIELFSAEEKWVLNVLLNDVFIVV